MKTMRTMTLTALALLAGSLALAQGGPGPGPGMGMGGGPRMQAAASAASMPGRGPGMGPGHRAARWGGDYTPGWALLSEQERNQHREQMRSLKTYEECQTYMAQHREQMTARAKEAGKTLRTPRRDACAGLKQ